MTLITKFIRNDVSYVLSDSRVSYIDENKKEITAIDNVDKLFGGEDYACGILGEVKVDKGDIKEVVKNYVEENSNFSDFNYEDLFDRITELGINRDYKAHLILVVEFEDDTKTVCIDLKNYRLIHEDFNGGYELTFNEGSENEQMFRRQAEIYMKRKLGTGFVSDEELEKFLHDSSPKEILELLNYVYECFDKSDRYRSIGGEMNYIQTK